MTGVIALKKRLLWLYLFADQVQENPCDQTYPSHFSDNEKWGIIQAAGGSRILTAEKT